MEESKRAKSRSSGFSLIEVLMSLLIIVVVVGTIRRCLQTA
ncbi:prepilin-type N-terminal cleavage/methylation domain-containing protein [Mesotoga sp. B105.6.4]